MDKTDLIFLLTIETAIKSVSNNTSCDTPCNSCLVHTAAHTLFNRPPPPHPPSISASQVSLRYAPATNGTRQ